MDLQRQQDSEKQQDTVEIPKSEKTDSSFNVRHEVSYSIKKLLENKYGEHEETVFQGLRKYNPESDTLSLVDQKASARAGEMIVRDEAIKRFTDMHVLLEVNDESSIDKTLRILDNVFRQIGKKIVKIQIGIVINNELRKVITSQKTSLPALKKQVQKLLKETIQTEAPQRIPPQQLSKFFQKGNFNICIKDLNQNFQKSRLGAFITKKILSGKKRSELLLINSAQEKSTEHQDKQEKKENPDDLEKDSPYIFLEKQLNQNSDEQSFIAIPKNVFRAQFTPAQSETTIPASNNEILKRLKKKGIDIIDAFDQIGEESQQNSKKPITDIISNAKQSDLNRIFADLENRNCFEDLQEKWEENYRELIKPLLKKLTAHQSPEIITDALNEYNLPLQIKQRIILDFDLPNPMEQIYRNIGFSDQTESIDTWKVTETMTTQSFPYKYKSARKLTLNEIFEKHSAARRIIQFKTPVDLAGWGNSTYIEDPDAFFHLYPHMDHSIRERILEILASTPLKFEPIGHIYNILEDQYLGRNDIKPIINHFKNICFKVFPYLSPNAKSAFRKTYLLYNIQPHFTSEDFDDMEKYGLDRTSILQHSPPDGIWQSRIEKNPKLCAMAKASMEMKESKELCFKHAESELFINNNSHPNLEPLNKLPEKIIEVLESLIFYDYFVENPDKILPWLENSLASLVSSLNLIDVKPNKHNNEARTSGIKIISLQLLELWGHVLRDYPKLAAEAFKIIFKNFEPMGLFEPNGSPFIGYQGLSWINSFIHKKKAVETISPEAKMYLFSHLKYFYQSLLYTLQNNNLEEMPNKFELFNPGNFELFNPGNEDIHMSNYGTELNLSYVFDKEFKEQTKDLNNLMLKIATEIISMRNRLPYIKKGSKEYEIIQKKFFRIKKQGIEDLSAINIDAFRPPYIPIYSINRENINIILESIGLTDIVSPEEAHKVDELIKLNEKKLDQEISNNTKPKKYRKSFLGSDKQEITATLKNNQIECLFQAPEIKGKMPELGRLENPLKQSLMLTNSFYPNANMHTWEQAASFPISDNFEGTEVERTTYSMPAPNIEEFILLAPLYSKLENLKVQFVNRKNGAIVPNPLSSWVQIHMERGNLIIKTNIPDEVELKALKYDIVLYEKPTIDQATQLKNIQNQFLKEGMLSEFKALTNTDYISDEYIPKHIIDFINSLDKGASIPELLDQTVDFISQNYFYDFYAHSRKNFQELREANFDNGLNLHEIEMIAIHSNPPRNYLGRGVCQNINRLLVAILRKIGIPCAPRSGIMIHEGQTIATTANLHLDVIAYLPSSEGNIATFNLDATPHLAGFRNNFKKLLIKYQSWRGKNKKNKEEFMAIDPQIEKDSKEDSKTDSSPETKKTNISDRVFPSSTTKKEKARDYEKYEKSINQVEDLILRATIFLVYSGISRTDNNNYQEGFIDLKKNRITNLKISETLTKFSLEDAKIKFSTFNKNLKEDIINWAITKTQNNEILNIQDFQDILR
ncbi:hypothetical protein KKG71_05795 [Patescibacteria group bacterium]|nr:hypothetical protein [Patescibacteria group bacterium]